jgi:hypothetical protein
MLKKIRLEKIHCRSILAQETSFFDQNKSADLASLLSEDVQVTANAITGNLAKLYRYLNSAVGTS